MIYMRKDSLAGMLNRQYRLCIVFMRNDICHQVAFFLKYFVLQNSSRNKSAKQQCSICAHKNSTRTWPKTMCVKGQSSLTSIVEVFSRAIWSSRVSSRKPGSCLAKSTISCTDMMASSVKWANRCCRTSRLSGSWFCGQGWKTTDPDVNF